MESNYLKTPLILIVDDNPENLQVLGKLFKNEKYEVEFAIDGIAALGWLNDKQFDLILLDINMPGISGFEVCRIIRSNRDMNKVPVIFLSAESEREKILTGFEMGGQDYITKPYDSRELIVRVKTHITLKFSLEKLEALNRSLEEKVRERTYQLREANEKLVNTNIKLIDLDKAKSEFLNLISHEIRTPLNGIIGPINLLKDSFFEQEIADLVDILDLSVKRLEKFALNALLVTRLRTNSKLSKSLIQLEKIFIDVLNEFEDKISLKNLQIRHPLYPDHISISSEYNIIKICIDNIIDNAIRFSPVDGLIEIRCFIEDNYTVAEVQDHGAGFSKVVLDKAFELFVIDDTLADNQTGMGLHIVKMIMDGHGGNAKVFNDPSGGAVVRLEFIKSEE